MSITPISSTASADCVSIEATAEPQVLQLHPSVDATIVVKGSEHKDKRLFLESSETLSLASPYFKALFGPSFKEGRLKREGMCPQIILEEDDPSAMEVLLSVLHFHHLHMYQTLDPETIAKVALQSDKYDCSRALLPWTCRWLHNTGVQPKPEDYGFLLTAAFLLGSAEYFKSVSATSMRHMAPDFLTAWSKYEILNRLPWRLKS